MRSLFSFLGAGIIVSVLAPPASATSLVLQYDVTITDRCVPSQGPCSPVNIGGLPLTLTTDDAFSSRETYPNETRAYFGPTTLAIDTSSLGDFPNPSGGGDPFTISESSLYNTDYGSYEQTTVFIRRIRTEESVEDDETTHIYLVMTTLGRGREGVPDAVPTNFTSADVGINLAQDLLFYHSVRSVTCVGSDPCVPDPRNFEVFGIATPRDPLAPVPEPATALLFGPVLAALVTARRRQGRARV